MSPCYGWRKLSPKTWSPLMPVLLALVALIPSGPVPAQVVKRDQMTVEFIGLDSWDPARIDTELTGGKPAEVYYCAANLKQDLGMADASVVHDSDADGRAYVLVTVVEPQHADRVRFRPAPGGRSFPGSDWSDLERALTSRSVEAQRALLDYGSHLRRIDDAPGPDNPEVDGDGDGASPTVVHIWRLLTERRTQADFDRAIRAIAHEPEPAARIAAAAILAGFPDRDLALFALVEALRDAEPAVRTTSGQALITWIQHSARPVDWEPVADELRHVLAGTNLFAFPWVLELLVASDVSSDLAPALLYDGGDLVLDALTASHAKTSARALALLERLSGRSWGKDRNAWRHWIDTLNADR